MSRVTQRAALAALSVLVEYGKQSFRDPRRAGVGAAMGRALGKFDLRPSQVLDAAGEALEDQNNHGLAAVVWALKEPRNLRRDPTGVRIALPREFHEKAGRRRGRTPVPVDALLGRGEV